MFPPSLVMQFHGAEPSDDVSLPLSTNLYSEIISSLLYLHNLNTQPPQYFFGQNDTLPLLHLKNHVILSFLQLNLPHQTPSASLLKNRGIPFSKTFPRTLNTDASGSIKSASGNKSCSVPPVPCNN